MSVLHALGPLGALSLLASDAALVVSAAFAVAVLPVAWCAARREAARVPRRVTILQDGRVRVDGDPVPRARLQWRGPVAVLQWREGRRLRALSWWPDTLPPEARRALKLAPAVAP